MCFGGDNSAKKEAKRVRAKEEAREARVRSGTERVNSIFSQNFNEPFFTGRRNAYASYATPQLEDQFKDAGDELTFALARSGTLGSSMRADKSSDLQKLFDIRKQEVKDEAVSQETAARGNVEGARTDLVSMLNATGDAEGAVNSATSRIKTLSASPKFNPLAQLFQDFTATLGSKAAMARAEALSGGVSTPSSTGLFGSGGAVINR